MKKLLVLVLAGAAAYFVWQYLQEVNQKAALKQNQLRSPSEKALKDMDKQ
jgi:hypothetical protein